MTTPAETKIAKSAPAPVTANKPVTTKKEENTMKVNVSYIINETKSTKEVTLDEAIASSLALISAMYRLTIQ